MIVKSTDTVRDIIIGRAALFNLESRRFAEEIKRRAEPECCVLHRRWLPDRRIAARDPKHMTMRDLAVLNATNRSTDYFVNVLSQMLGIPKEKVADLRFIRAYRYFLHCMDTLAAISKRFADLKIEPTDEERQAVRDGNVVTANGTGYLEFTRECLLVLKADTPDRIEASYKFNKYGFCRQ